VGNPDDVFDYLISQGASPAGAAGVVGDLQGESSANVDPAIIGDYGTSGGIAQWHNDRWQKLKAFAASLGKPWTDLGVQEQYLVKDLKAYGLWDMVKSANDPAPVVDALVRRYELPAKPDQAVATRTPFAQAMLKKDEPGVWDRVKNPLGTAQDAAGAAGDAASSAIGEAFGAATDKAIGAASPILWKGLFVGLGVALLGAGIVKSFNVKLPSVGGGMA
jgi:hypothetical protein